MNKTAKMVVVLATIIISTAGFIWLLDDTGTSADPGTDRGSTYSDIVDAVIDFNGDGWEAGAILQLDDEQAFSMFKTLILAIPEDMRGELDRYSDEDGLRTLYDDYLEGDVTASSKGVTYAALTCLDTDDGYLYGLLAKGSMEVDTYQILGKDRDVDLYFDGSITADFVLTAEMTVTRDLVPEELSFDLTINIVWDGTCNYDYINDGHDALEEPVQFDKRDVFTFLGGVWIDGLTSDDMKDILHGEGSPEVTYGYLFDQCGRYTVGANGDEYVTNEHLEFLKEVSLSQDIMDSEGVPSVDALVDGYLAMGFYGPLQILLESRGLFITEEQYDGMVSALKNVKGHIRECNVDFYYIHSGSVYNTELKEKVAAYLEGLVHTAPKPLIEDSGPYTLHYYLEPSGDCYTIGTFDGDYSKVPPSINGIQVHLWYGNKTYDEEGFFEADGLIYRTLSNDPTSVRIVGIVPRTTEVRITDSVTIDGTRYSVSGYDSIIADHDVELELLEVSSSSIYLSNIRVKEIVLSDSYLYVDGESTIGHIAVGHSGGVLIKGDTHVESIDCGGADILTYGNSSIKSIHYDSEEPYRLYAKYLNRINGLEDLRIEGAIYSIVGIISVDGYGGIGSMITLDGINYESTVIDGEVTIFFDSFVEGATEVTIHSTIGIGEAPYAVTLDWWNNDDITKVTIESMPESMDLGVLKSLRTVVFDNLEPVSVDDSTFRQCYGLETVIFNGLVSVIGSDTFRDTIGIETLEFNSGVDSISSGAFQSLPGITELVFRGDVGTLEAGSFSPMSNLERISFLGDVSVLDGFQGCDKLTSVSVTGSVGTIPGGAFADHHPYRILNGETVHVDWTLSAGSIGTICDSAFSNTSLTDFDAGLILNTKNCGCNAFIDCVFDGKPYAGIGSGISPTVMENGIRYQISPYIRDHEVSVDIGSIQVDAGSGTSTISIPERIGFDGTSYTVASIGKYNSTCIASEGSYSLHIGSNVKELGDGFNGMFGQMTITDVVIDKGSPYIAVKEGGYVFVAEIADDGYRKISVFVDADSLSDVFTVPSGFKAFDLGWIDMDGVETLNTGDKLESLISEYSGDLRTINIGSNLTDLQFSPNHFPSLKSLTVDPSNTCYSACDGVLYRVNEGTGDATLMMCPPGMTGELEIPSEVVIGTGDHPVTELNPMSFHSSSLTKVVIPDTIIDLGDAIFHGSDITEIVLPDTIENISCDFASFADPNINIHTINRDVESGNVVYTHDGGLYFLIHIQSIVDGESVDIVEKRMLDHYGGTDMILVEEGTSYVRICSLDSDSGTYIVLPDSVTDFGILRPSDIEESLEILMPSEAYKDLNWNYYDASVRIYQTGPHHSWSFSVDEGGLTATVTVSDGCTFQSLYIGEQSFENGATIPWDVLFASPVPDSGTYDEIMTLDLIKEELEVTYVIGGGFPNETIVVPYGGQAEAIDGPVRTGYIFKGWYADPEYTIGYDFSEEVTTDITIYAKWDVEMLTVTVVIGLDHPDETVKVQYRTYWYMENPEHEGYRFMGWGLDPDSGRTEDTIIITEDTVVYGRWLPVYNVSLETEGMFIRLGGTWIDSTDVLQLTEGSYYISWYVREGYHGTPVLIDDLGTVLSGFVTIDRDTSIHAEGILKNSETFLTVSFQSDSDKGTCTVPSETVVYGTGPVLPEVVATEGYRFVGWTYGSHIVNGEFTVYEDITLTAAYAKVPVTVSFEVDGDRGTLVGGDRITVVKGEGIQLPDVEPADGWIFIGWTVDGQYITSPYTPTSDVTIIAKIVRNPSPVSPPVTPVLPEDPVDRPDGTYTDDDGSTTTVKTNEDGSKTVIVQKDIENGTETSESVYDSDKQLLGIATLIETEEITDTGNTVNRVISKFVNADGTTTYDVTKIESVSEDGSIRTTAVTTTDKNGNTTSESTTVISVSGTSGDVVVNDESVRKAIEQMAESVSENTEKVISIQPEGSAESAKVTMSQDAMQSIVESSADVMIGGEEMSIRMSSDVSKNLSSMGGDVAMSVGKADRNSMNPVQQQKVGNAPVFQLTADVGGQSVHELGGTVTVTIPYELSAGENPDDVRVFYLDDDGGLHVKRTVYDAETETVTFETDHFSYYMVGSTADIGSDEPTTDKESNDNTLMYIGVAVIAVIVICIAAVAVRKH